MDYDHYWKSWSEQQQQQQRQQSQTQDTDLLSRVSSYLQIQPAVKITVQLLLLWIINYYIIAKTFQNMHIQ